MQLSKRALALLPLCPIKLTWYVQRIFSKYCAPFFIVFLKDYYLLQEALPTLPNEIWSNIIEYLSADDRKSIASVDEKFHELEGNTGYRRFANIKIASVSRFILNF